MNKFKWLSAAAYAAVLAAVYFYHQPIIAWMKAGNAPAALMALAAAGFAFFPIIPYGIVIGALGYMYGPLAGGLISLFGAWTAALLMFGALRYFFQDKGRQWLGKVRHLDGFVRMTERHPFLSILIARMIPVIPQYAVNAYAAVAGIPFALYAAASALGKVPAMLVYAYAGQSLAAHPSRIVALAVGYIAFLGLVLIAYRRLASRS
ncbi:hypothetical protein VE23_21585 [Paenibacillus sp. D9]|uniref:TVP38/TMEM64 family protein n=1 Tax=Paenibacillus sp. D9 TaxID=665792 RepID=UPI00061E0416|nr:VTT domain-containing protein [Paenibacillus sp. D9]KKC49083.1 hypothetical protein VE23_21585 [Paenibacillus sp. D9]